MNDRSQGIKAWLLKLEIATPDMRAGTDSLVESFCGCS